jgi:hypothetical protein
MWLPWLEREFGWTVRTADRYMQVAKAFKLDTVSNFDGLTIGGSALYCLAERAARGSRRGGHARRGRQVMRKR